MQVIDPDLITQALYEAEIGDDEDEIIRERYSGRGMYGDECFGLVFSGAAELARFFVGLSQNEENLELAYDLARATREDNMGRSYIYYFVGFQLATSDAVL